MSVLPHLYDKQLKTIGLLLHLHSFSGGKRNLPIGWERKWQFSENMNQENNILHYIFCTEEDGAMNIVIFTSLLVHCLICHWSVEFILVYLFSNFRFGVESAPAIVFLKDPGVKPVVHHGLFHLSSYYSITIRIYICPSNQLTVYALCIAGSINNSIFLNLMENNKQQGRCKFIVHIRMFDSHNFS